MHRINETCFILTVGPLQSASPAPKQMPEEWPALLGFQSYPVHEEMEDPLLL